MTWDQLVVGKKYEIGRRTGCKSGRIAEYVRKPDWGGYIFKTILGDKIEVETIERIIREVPEEE